MSDSVLPFLCLTFLAVIALIVWDRERDRQQTKQIRQEMRSQEQWILEVLQQKTQENRDLLNRLMSADLTTYATMTRLGESSSDFEPEQQFALSDEQAAYLLAREQGLAAFDDETDPQEVAETLRDAGLFGEVN